MSTDESAPLLSSSSSPAFLEKGHTHPHSIISIPAVATPLLSDSPATTPTSITTFHSLSQSKPATHGYFFMLLSAFCHSLVTFLVHLAELRASFPAISCLIVRASTSFLLSSSYLIVHHEKVFRTSSLTPRRLVFLFLRGLFGGLTMLLSFSALARLPVGTAVTLFYASPALTAIASALLLRDHPLTGWLMLTIAANFIGIALVSGPSTQGLHAHWDGIFCALGMAMSSTTVFILQRAMGSNVHFILGTFAHSIGCALNAALTVQKNDIVQLFNNHWGLLFATCSGLAGFGSQTFMNIGLQSAPAGPAILVRSLSVPLAVILGAIFLKELPPLEAFAGMILVLLSVAVIGRMSVKDKAESQKKAVVGGTDEEAQRERI